MEDRLHSAYSSACSELSECLSPHAKHTRTHSHTPVYTRTNKACTSVLCGPLTSPKGDVIFRGGGVICRVSTPAPNHALSLSFQHFGEIPMDGKNCPRGCLCNFLLVLIAAGLLLSNAETERLIFSPLGARKRKNSFLDV